MSRWSAMARAWCTVAANERNRVRINLGSSCMREWQFKLRTLLGTIIAIAVLLAWVRWQGSIDQALAVISRSSQASGICLLLAFLSARVSGPTIRRGGARGVVLGLLISSFLAATYLGWAHYRATYHADLRLDSGFPFPDAAINALERWFDARRPVAPGSLKLHGEFPTVVFILGMCALAFTTLIGIFAGLLLRPMESGTQRGGRRTEGEE